jgi:hypothetical protein
MGAGAYAFIVTVQTGGFIAAHRFQRGTDTTITSLGNLTGPSSVTTHSTATVHGTTNQWAVAYATSAPAAAARRFNVSAVQQGVTHTASATAALSVDVQASLTENSILVVTKETTNVRAYEFNLTDLTPDTSQTVEALVDGPSVFCCFQPLQSGAILGASYAIVYTSSSANGLDDSFIEFRDVGGLGASDTSRELPNFLALGRPVQGCTPGQSTALLVPGTVGPAEALLGASDTVDQSRTHMLVYITSALSSYFAQDQLTAVHALCSLSKDEASNACVWSRISLDALFKTVFRSCSFDFQSPAQRQKATFSGRMFIAGGQPQTFDGRACADMGFPEVPGIISATGQSSAGALTTLGQYDYVTTWSFTSVDGDVDQSAPSAVTSVTLSGVQDTVLLSVTSPHTQRAWFSEEYRAGTMSINVWRTVWDGSGKEPGFRLVGSRAPVLVSDDTIGATLGFFDRVSDDDLRERDLLYTDAGGGALSGGLPRVAPDAFEYVWPTDEGIVVSGTPQRNRFILPMPKQPGQALSFAPNALTGVSFYGSAEGEVRAVAAFDGFRVFFTDSGISISSDPSPDADGRGETPRARAIPVSYKLNADAWPSLLLTQEGLWFRSGDDKLCALPRGGSVPEWKGLPVRDLVRAYPTCNGAAVVESDNAAVFSASSESDSVILVRDSRVAEWSYDELPATNGPIASLVEYEGRAAYIRQSRVWLQTDEWGDTTDIALGTLGNIPMTLEFGDSTPFGISGDGELCQVVVAAEFRDNCTVTLSYSFDSGKTYRQCNAQTLTTADYAEGEGVDLYFAPRFRKCPRYRLKLEVTHTGPSEMLTISGLSVYVMGKQGPKREREARRS